MKKILSETATVVHGNNMKKIIKFLVWFTQLQALKHLIYYDIISRVLRLRASFALFILRVCLEMTNCCKGVVIN